MILYLIVGIALSVFLFPGYQHEVQRWNDHLSKCTKQYEENIRILQHSTCSDLFQLDSLGPKMRDVCLKARSENELTPTTCAWRNFWIEGEIYQLWTRVAHNQWMLAFILVPSCLLVIYMWMYARAEKQKMEMIAQDRQALMEGFKSIAQISSLKTNTAHALQEPEYYIRNDDDDDDNYVQLALPPTRRKRKTRRMYK